MTYSYNQTIEYIDGTRDLNFEAAQRWAQEHGTTFEEDVSKREPYEQEHEETYMNPTTGADEVRLVKTPTLKRFWVIGNEPKPYVPTEDELKAQVRAVRNQYLKQYVDDRAKSPFMWNEVTEEEKALISEYRKYLLDYPETEGWYEQNPMNFEEWKAQNVSKDEMKGGE